DPAIATHRGRIVKTTGDGILIEFPSVVDAVRCAVEVQQQMTAKDANQPQDKRIAFRVGIHIGDVVVEGDDLLGDGVNVAARLESVAEPGGVYISEDAYRQIRDRAHPSSSIAGSNSRTSLALCGSIVSPTTYRLRRREAVLHCRCPTSLRL